MRNSDQIKQAFDYRDEAEAREDEADKATEKLAGALATLIERCCRFCYARRPKPMRRPAKR